MVVLYAMKRPIFVRPMSDTERETLEAGLRSPDAFTLRRCQILLKSADGQNAYQIANNLGCNPHKAEWVVGFEDECWWSRAAQPNLHSFSEEGEPLRLVEQSLPKEDPDPKAISCYGLYMPELKLSWLKIGRAHV